MSTLTIPALDKRVEKLIRAKALVSGKTFDQTIRELLAISVGMTDSNAEAKTKTDFSEFCGIWNEQEAEEFNEVIADLSQVDPSEWK